MKMLAIGFMVLALTFAAVSFALAQEKAAEVKPELTGTIASVDAATQKLVVSSGADADAKETALVVDAASKIEKDGKAATLAELAAGDTVTLSYKADEKGQNVVSTLTAKAAVK